MSHRNHQRKSRTLPMARLARLCMAFLAFAESVAAFSSLVGTTRAPVERHVATSLNARLKTRLLLSNQNGENTRRTTVTRTDEWEKPRNRKETSSCKPILNLSQLEQQLSQCQTGTAARRVLETNLLMESDTDGSSGKLYKSISIPPDASAKGLSDGDLGIMTRIRNSKYSIFELIDLNGNRDADRASLGVFSVFVASTLSALVANQNLPGPDILRFIVVWLFSFAPLALVGYGIATPDQLQALLVSIQRLAFPLYRKRMLQHEAGHFLMSHLLGYPIQDYQSNAVKNAVTFYPLNDPDIGRDRAKQLGFDKLKQSNDIEDIFTTTSTNRNAPFFSPGGRGSNLVEEQSVFRKEGQQKLNYTAFSQLDQSNEPRQSWPFRGFDDITLDQLTVISVAGVCAEILAFGNAEGGLADFNQLKQLLANAEREESISEREINNRIRFALGYSMSQLRRHLGALDALAEVMERDGSIAECVLAIESCDNISGNDGTLEDYEVRRKSQFQQTNPILALTERLFLGETKTADVAEDRWVEGKGGGYKKEKQSLITGDDPLYLALGVAIVFFLWASSGGLSLH